MPTGLQFAIQFYVMATEPTDSEICVILVQSTLFDLLITLSKIVSGLDFLQ